MKFYKICNFVAIRMVVTMCLIINVLILSVVEASEQSVPLIDHGTNTFYINTAIGSLQGMDFMLDTGSGYTTINEESLSRLMPANQAVFVKNISGILADGSQRIVPIWRVNKIMLSGICELKDVEVAVFPGKTRQLLGVSALKKVGSITLSFDPPRLRLENCL